MTAIDDDLGQPLISIEIKVDGSTTIPFFVNYTDNILRIDPDAEVGTYTMSFELSDTYDNVTYTQ